MLDRDIVDKLLSKYETSKAFLNPESKRKVELKISESFFDGLRNGSPDLDVALETIGRQGFCDIRYQDDYLERLILKTDPGSIEKAYVFANRSNPKERLALLKEYFAAKQFSDSSIVRLFAKSALASLEKGRPTVIENAFGMLDDIRVVVACIEAIEKLETDVPERVFSSNILGDSKSFAQHRTKVEKIIREFSEMAFEEDDDPIAAYGVIQNRTYAFAKGLGTFRVGRETIDLSKYGHEIAMSDEIIDELEILDIPATKLFTVENLTSFNEFSVEDAIIVYLGGFHNSVRRKLIEKIYGANPSMECFHYGDIDAGGFYILNHLREKTGIHFLPFMMDQKVLERFMNKAKKLTSSDRERLEKMKDDVRFAEFSSAISFMLEHNVKLEQEAELEI